MLFPQLTPGTVAYFNRMAVSYDEIEPLSDELVAASMLQHSMLFEIACVKAEMDIQGRKFEWDECVAQAISRQKRHFDAIPPTSFVDSDFLAVDQVSRNTLFMLEKVKNGYPLDSFVVAPEICGYQWVSSSVGDFSIADTLVEVKCTGRNFGSSDYRQILMYWLLSYSASIEKDKIEWNKGVLLNPRRNRLVELPFNELVEVTSGGKSKVELLELFAAIVGDYAHRTLSEFRL